MKIKMIARDDKHLYIQEKASERTKNKIFQIEYKNKDCISKNSKLKHEVEIIRKEEEAKERKGNVVMRTKVLQYISLSKKQVFLNIRTPNERRFLVPKVRKCYLYGDSNHFYTICPNKKNYPMLKK